jgi:hypothetical protein
MTTLSQIAAAPSEAPLWRQLTWWVLLLPLTMVVALVQHNAYLLNYTHVMAGALWTGADLFLGFVLAPVMRRLQPTQRTAVIGYLVPRTLLYLPVVAFTTGTAGWYLATWENLLDPSSPVRLWIIFALVITSLLAVQGLGVLLPNSIRIYLELRRPQPDTGRIWRLNRVNLVIAGVQGCLQVVIILVMARLAVG